MRYALALLLSLAASLSWAQEPVARLPAGSSQLLVSGETYFYAGGTFYRPVEGGYLRVAPPKGARVPSIPGQSEGFTLGGNRYFLAPGNTFFLYDPGGGDYTVVNPPPGWRDRYRERQGISSLPAPRPPPPTGEVPKAYPPYRSAPGDAPAPRRYRSDTYYGLHRGRGYYGRYSFRDDFYGQSYRERRAQCRRIATDQSRRSKIGPYRREPGSYREEFERCMR